jgi:radical SAM superfamily enzyme YgiQ (UPF0313 family)
MLRTMLEAKKPSLPKAFRIPPEMDQTVQPMEVTQKSVLLINPFYVKDPNSSFGKHALTPSLALSSIAGATPADWDVEFWDENLLQGPPPHSPFPQVVGITVHLTFAERAYELAEWYRSRGSVVVFGGLHVQACADECRPHADTIVFGDGVQVWEQILRDIEQNYLKQEYTGSYRRPFSEDPAPRRSIVPKDQFLTSASVIATRGCHNRCNFCYLSTEGMHMPYSMRSIRQIVHEIEMEKATYVVFIDNNLGSKKPYLRQLCAALEPMDIIWSAAVTIDVTDDPDLVKAMAASGCTGVFIGFESLNEQSLMDTGKRTPAPDDYARRVRILQDAGIQVNGSFVVGFDHDHPDVFEKTVKWIEDVRLESANFQILTPYPGTPLFKEMKRAGRILHTDWSRYDTGNVVFKPQNMTTDELQRGYEWMYRRQNSLASIWIRRPRDITAAPGYLAGSLLYRKSNWLWHLLLKYRQTNRVWKPLVKMNRRRHIRKRKKSQQIGFCGTEVFVPPGV